jgi:hypothetical protein
MMNSRVIYTYLNMYFNNILYYFNNMKNNSNAVDKSFCAVITEMITYTIYMKLPTALLFFMFKYILI